MKKREPTAIGSVRATTPITSIYAESSRINASVSQYSWKVKFKLW